MALANLANIMSFVVSRSDMTGAESSLIPPYSSLEYDLAIINLARIDEDPFYSHSYLVPWRLLQPGTQEWLVEGKRINKYVHT